MQYNPLVVFIIAIFSSTITGIIMKIMYSDRIAQIEAANAVNIIKLGAKLGFNGDPTAEQDKFIEFLERNGFHNPTVWDEKPHFKVADEDLDLLMNIGGDMLVGRANMDTAIWFMQSLDRVLDRLRPHEAPFHDGQSTITKTPPPNVS